MSENFVLFIWVALYGAIMAHGNIKGLSRSREDAKKAEKVYLNTGFGNEVTLLDPDGNVVPEWKEIDVLEALRLIKEDGDRVDIKSVYLQGSDKITHNVNKYDLLEGMTRQGATLNSLLHCTKFYQKVGG